MLREWWRRLTRRGGGLVLAQSAEAEEVAAEFEILQAECIAINEASAEKLSDEDWAELVGLAWDTARQLSAVCDRAEKCTELAGVLAAMHREAAQAWRDADTLNQWLGTAKKDSAFSPQEIEARQLWFPGLHSSTLRVLTAGRRAHECKTAEDWTETAQEYRQRVRELSERVKKAKGDLRMNGTDTLLRMFMVEAELWRNADELQQVAEGENAIAGALRVRLGDLDAGGLN